MAVGGRGRNELTAAPSATPTAPPHGDHAIAHAWLPGPPPREHTDLVATPPGARLPQPVV